MKEWNEVLPCYFSVPHLPFEPNLGEGDHIATQEEIQVLLKHAVVVEEKMDGSNSAIYWGEPEPILRNRRHILRKGYQKDTPAKKQFVPLWNWAQENRKKFDKLAGFLGAAPVVYGEWCYAVHTLTYTVPDWFIPFELYDPTRRIWIAPPMARSLLHEAGFVTMPLVYQGWISSLESLCVMRDGPSAYGAPQREGIFIKAYDDQQVLARFKMVVAGFSQGNHLTDGLVRQKRAKTHEYLYS